MPKIASDANPSVEPRPPKLRHSLLEFSRVAAEWGSAAVLSPLHRALPAGDGHTVLALPGFMGADGSTAMLRKFLIRRGYHAIPWGLGRNGASVRSRDIDDFLRHREETEEQLAGVIEAEYERTGRKVSLIGWSLGGLFAVALAHRHPEWIDQVITLGTPYGDPRGTAIYTVMDRLFEAEVDEDALVRWVDHTFSGGELKVPVLALYSESDGIVGTDIAQCPGDSRYVTNMAVPASHVGFPFNPVVFAVIGNALAAPSERWNVCGSAWIAPFAKVV